MTRLDVMAWIWAVVKLAPSTTRFPVAIAAAKHVLGEGRGDVRFEGRVEAVFASVEDPVKMDDRSDIARLEPRAKDHRGLRRHVGRLHGNAL